MIVIGAGLAGAAVAFALAERGREVIVLEAGGTVASGASGNPAGVVKPFVTRDESPTNAFYRFTHRALVDLLDRPGWAERCGFHSCGVLQLVNTPYAERPDYQMLDAAAASAHAGHVVSSPAMWFADGGWLDPARLCMALLDHPLIDCRLNRKVSELQTDGDGGWSIHVTAASGSMADEQMPADPTVAHRMSDAQRRGRTDGTLRCGQLVLATGMALTGHPFTECLSLTPARGQLSRFATASDGKALRCVVSGRHYALPAERSVFVGATFERDDVGLEVRATDHHSNLQGLKGLLPSLRVVSEALGGRAGVRATTPDRLPMLGPAPDIKGYRRDYTGLQHGQSTDRFPQAPLHEGLHVFGGLGSRGINVAVGCGQLLASHLCGESETLQHWMPLLHPARFCIRSLRRAG